MPVYFVKEGNFVKIGFCADVRSRVIQARVFNYRPLKLLAVIDGDRVEEKEIHSRFAKQRWRHEWFLFKGPVEEYIKTLPLPDPSLAPKGSYPIKGKSSIVGKPFIVLPREGMIATTLRTNLVLIARAYAVATRKGSSTVSKKFYGQGTFFRDFAAGKKSISLDNYDRVVKAFIKEWPENAEWPYLRPAIMRPPDSLKKKKIIPK